MSSSCMAPKILLRTLRCAAAVQQGGTWWTWWSLYLSAASCRFICLLSSPSSNGEGRAACPLCSGATDPRSSDTSCPRRPSWIRQAAGVAGRAMKPRRAAAAIATCTNSLLNWKSLAAKLEIASSGNRAGLLLPLASHSQCRCQLRCPAALRWPSAPRPVPVQLIGALPFQLAFLCPICCIPWHPLCRQEHPSRALPRERVGGDFSRRARGQEEVRSGVQPRACGRAVCRRRQVQPQHGAASPLD